MGVPGSPALAVENAAMIAVAAIAAKIAGLRMPTSPMSVARNLVATL
jgi:hypothetical protein